MRASIVTAGCGRVMLVLAVLLPIAASAQVSGGTVRVRQLDSVHASAMQVRHDSLWGDVSSLDAAEPARSPNLAGTAPRDSSQRPDGQFLAVGDTVRVFGTTSQPLRGVLRSVDSTSMTVEALATGSNVGMPRALITRIETLRGHPRRGIRALVAGAVIGSITGMAAGSVVAGVKGEDGELAFIAVIGGGAVGAIVGTSIGVYAAFTRGDRWIPVGPNTLLLLETP